MSAWRRDITFGYDYWGVFLYDTAAEFSAQRTEYADAAKRSAHGWTVGIAGPLVSVPMPAQWNAKAALAIIVAPAPPEVDAPSWDHIVEFDLDLPSGTLVLEEPGGGARTTLALAPGLYRARFAGTNFQQAYDADFEPGDQPDVYRLELWPREAPEPAAEPKRWPGFDTR